LGPFGPFQIKAFDPIPGREVHLPKCVRLPFAPRRRFYWNSDSVGLATEFSDPGGFPPGMNVPCTLTDAHPFPVVLVAGTGANENVSWQALSPALADEGYCVYGFNYGATSVSDGRFYGLGDIPTSAQTLAQIPRRPGRKRKWRRRGCDQCFECGD